MPDSIPEAGILGHFSALLAAKLSYLRARLELAGLEGKEAAVHIGVILGLALGALLAVLLGYLFLVIFLVFLVAWACGGGDAWIWVTLGASVLHLIGGAVLLLIAKARLKTPMFPATLDEFKHDQECLKTNAKPN